MSTTQKFKVVGITVHGDNAKVRFTDDMIRRIKQFTKGGATRCEFVELPNPMTKVEALKYMQSNDKFQSIEDQATIADSLADREKEAKVGTVKVKVEKTAKAKGKAKPSLDAIKARSKKPAKAAVAEASDTAGQPAVDTATV